MINESNLDLLWVASPNHLHLEHIRLGLEAGLKVFSEKPIVTTKEDSFALAKLIKKYCENQLIVGLVLRYSVHMKEMRRVIDAGTLGKITSLEANELKAGEIFIDWNENKLESRVKDSIYPSINGFGESPIFGEKMEFDLISKKGKITQGETNFNQSF